MLKYKQDIVYETRFIFIFLPGFKRERRGLCNIPIHLMYRILHWCEMELGTYHLGGGGLPLGGSCLDEFPE